MTDRGLTNTLKHSAQLGTDVAAVNRFVDHHQKLLHDIEVSHITSRVQGLADSIACPIRNPPVRRKCLLAPADLYNCHCKMVVVVVVVVVVVIWIILLSVHPRTIQVFVIVTKCIITTTIIWVIIIPGQFLWCCHDGLSRFKSSPVLFNEYRLSAGWPPTLRPSQSTWAVSLPIGCCHPHHHCHLLLLLNPKADAHFTFPWRVEGWVDLGTAVKVHSPRLYIDALTTWPLWPVCAYYK